MHGNARLVVLHAWWLASGFNVVVVDGVIRDQWAARSREEMQPVLTPLREQFPDVEVTIEVRHAPPVEAVLDAAEGSDLLVLGRRHHRLPIGSHLGPVVRAALDHGICPVLRHPGARRRDRGVLETEDSRDLATTRGSEPDWQVVAVRRPRDPGRFERPGVRTGGWGAEPRSDVAVLKVPR